MSERKKTILYAIVPAIIAGIFAVSPKLYDELTEPQAVLEYDISKGPILNTDSGYKSIYSIRVSNNGKKPLTEINALIKNNGTIEAINTYENTGLSPTIKDTPTTVTVKTLHPGESFTISLMLVTPNNSNQLDFILRSKEILGTLFKPDDAGRTKKLDICSGIASALSVFIMALYFMSRAKGGKSLGPFNTHKTDILFYIAAKYGFTDIVKQLGINEENVTYLRFGDMLYATAILDESDIRKNAIMALKCMLLIEKMAETSRKLIIRNIKNLENDFSNEEILFLGKKASSISNLIELRESVDRYTDSPAAFLTSEDHTNSQ